MGDIFSFTGALLCTLGGIMLALLIVAILANFVCIMWMEASNKFRRICKVESMIFEYRENRNEYLEWKRAKEAGK